MASKEYLNRLKLVIEQLHRCAAFWIRTERIHEVFRGETVWQGEVEVFGLAGHPRAMRCYGWSYGESEDFITILGLPPVDSARAAVKVGAPYLIRQSRKEK